MATVLRFAQGLTDEDVEKAKRAVELARCSFHIIGRVELAWCGRRDGCYAIYHQPAPRGKSAVFGCWIWCDGASRSA